MKTLIAFLITSTMYLSGCNTIHGMGEDIEAGGEKISETADNVKDDMKE